MLTNKLYELYRWIKTYGSEVRALGGFQRARVLIRTFNYLYVHLITFAKSKSNIVLSVTKSVI